MEYDYEYEVLNVFTIRESLRNDMNKQNEFNNGLVENFNQKSYNYPIQIIVATTCQ